MARITIGGIIGQLTDWHDWPKETVQTARFYLYV